MNPMKVCTVQMRSVLGDAAANCQKIIELSSQCIEQGAQFVCFPEACLTGYSADRAAELAIDRHDPAVERLCAFAAERDIILSFGYIERADEEGASEQDDTEESASEQDAINPNALPFITQIVCSPQNTLAYRKTHLGASELDSFSSGNVIAPAQMPGASVGVSLCWECNIPDIASTLRAKGVEIIVAPFASPLSGEKRLNTWSLFMPARARDNGVYAVAVNANGGASAIYDPHGDVIAVSTGADDAILLCELDGELPRYGTSISMRNISYYDRRRPELYSR